MVLVTVLVILDVFLLALVIVTACTYTITKNQPEDRENHYPDKSCYSQLAPARYDS